MKKIAVQKSTYLPERRDVEKNVDVRKIGRQDR